VIVLVGSRHDRVSQELTARWSNAVLCSAEDLVAPGWVWGNHDPVARTWVASGQQIPDAQVSGVFVRRSAVYPEELTPVHPEDRAFLAAETQAFLTFVLATTAARVVNPVVDGAFGEEALRLERYGDAAARAGSAFRPIRVTTERTRRTRYAVSEVEVVGQEAFGRSSARVQQRALRLAATLGLLWAVVLFDSRSRLVTLTAARAPTEAAADALGRLLSARP
jgi:hypothetical protein